LIISLLLTTAFVALGLWLIGRIGLFQMPGVPVLWVRGIYLLKVAAGMALWGIYTYYYTDRSTADIYKYFDDAMVMHSALPHHPADFVHMLTGLGGDPDHLQRTYFDNMGHWYRPYGSSATNDTHTIIRFNALVRLVSMGHYPVHSAIMNLLSVMGLVCMVRFLAHSVSGRAKWVFAAVMLMPGVLFWGSGVLKEGLLFLGIGLLLRACAFLVYQDGNRRTAWLLLPAAAVLLTVKSYALIILPALIAMIPLLRMSVSAMWALYGVVALLLVTGPSVPGLPDVWQRLAIKQAEFTRLAHGGTYLQRITPSHIDTVYVASAHHDSILAGPGRFHVPVSVPMFPLVRVTVDSSVNVPHMSSERFNLLLDYGRTGSRIRIPHIDGTVIGTLRAAPTALVNALLRPWPWQADSPFLVLALIENLLLLGLFLLPIVFPSRPFDVCVVSLCLIFSLGILILTGLVTPVVGAIVRYKVPALPFLAAMCIHLTDTQRLEASLRSLFQR
jgi:hypothetical protein